MNLKEILTLMEEHCVKLHDSCDNCYLKANVMLGNSHCIKLYLKGTLPEKCLKCGKEL